MLLRQRVDPGGVDTACLEVVLQVLSETVIMTVQVIQESTTTPRILQRISLLEEAGETNPALNGGTLKPTAVNG